MNHPLLNFGRDNRYVQIINSTGVEFVRLDADAGVYTWKRSRICRRLYLYSLMTVRGNAARGVLVT